MIYGLELRIASALLGAPRLELHTHPWWLSIGGKSVGEHLPQILVVDLPL